MRKKIRREHGTRADRKGVRQWTSFAGGAFCQSDKGHVKRLELSVTKEGKKKPRPESLDDRRCMDSIVGPCLTTTSKKAHYDWGELQNGIHKGEEETQHVKEDSEIEGVNPNRRNQKGGADFDGRVLPRE